MPGLTRRPSRAAAVLMAALPALAVAHGSDAATVLPWTLDPWITVPLAIVLASYLIGAWRLRRRSTRGPTRNLGLTWFCGGWLVLAAALVTPLHAAGERSFTAHMLEHELLMLVAAPLLVLSTPVATWLWALPRTLRHSLARAGGHRYSRATWQTITAPLFATVLQALVLWGWHAPAAFNLALAHRGWHIVQHASFLVSALLFWWAMLQGGAAHRRGIAVACLFVTSLVSGALGALMAFSSGPWYAAYAQLGLDAFGMTAVEDQQLAGVLMWVPGGLVHAGVGLLVLARMLAPKEPAASAPG